MTDEPRVLLIGGSSHTGKSTLAQSLASDLGWNYRSTDKLARHPGRPWRDGSEVPKHVADHYLSLSAGELIADVLCHYKVKIWPLLENIVVSHSSDTSSGKLVIEGSAILPELVATLGLKDIVAIWLTASDELFMRRIHTASRYETRSAHEQMMIDKFLARTLLYNEHVVGSINQLGLISLDVESPTEPLSSKVYDLLGYKSTRT